LSEIEDDRVLNHNF